MVCNPNKLNMTVKCVSQYMHICKEKIKLIELLHHHFACKSLKWFFVHILHIALTAIRGSYVRELVDLAFYPLFVYYAMLRCVHVQIVNMMKIKYAKTRWSCMFQRMSHINIKDYLKQNKSGLESGMVLTLSDRL